MTTMDPILRTIDELKPPRKWTSKEASDFKKIYFQRTGKVIDSLNPSYPFSMFNDGSSYKIGGKSYDPNNLATDIQDDSKLKALMAQWERMTSKAERRLVPNLGWLKKDLDGSITCVDIKNFPNCKQYMDHRGNIIDINDAWKYNQKGEDTELGYHYETFYTPLYKGFAEQVASGLEKLKVTATQTRNDPPLKRRKLEHERLFKPVIFLKFSNRDATAFEKFLIRSDPNKQIKTVSTYPHDLIVQIKNLQRPADISYIDKNVVSVAKEKLADLAYQYVKQSCLLKSDISNQIEQYQSYLKGVRVKTILTYRQYEQNVNKIETGPLMKSRQAVLRRSLFKQWQTFAKSKTDQYLDILSKFKVIVADLGSKKSINRGLIQKVDITFDSACVNTMTYISSRPMTSKPVIVQSKKRNQRRKKKGMNVKAIRDAQQLKGSMAALPPGNYIPGMKGTPTLVSQCQQWFNDVVDIYKTKMNDSTLFKKDLESNKFTLRARNETNISYNVGRSTKKLNINQGTDVTTDAYIESLLTRETGGLRCSKQDMIFLNTLRKRKAAEIKTILKGYENNLRFKRQKKPEQLIAKAAVDAERIWNRAKAAAEREKKQKAIPVPPAPKESPWATTPTPKNIPVAKQKKVPVAVPVKKAPVNIPEAKAVPVKLPEAKAVPVRRSTRRGAKKMTQTQVKEALGDNNNNAPKNKIVVWSDTGGYANKKNSKLGAYAITDDFTVNGSYYLEREDIARTNNVNPRVDLIYKYAGAKEGEYTVRAKKDDAKSVGDRINALWLTNSSKEHTYDVRGDDIVLTYQGTTYTIKPPANAEKKYFLRKPIPRQKGKTTPLTFLWLEPKAKAESFKDANNNRKRLQNRVQITYDSMSEDDIAEIEKAMGEYDTKLEKTLSDYDSESDMSPQAYDSSSAVSNSKASYDSSSDVSMDKVSYDSSSDVSYDKASYDSQSDVDKVQRSMYDSSSEVASETEMDYSYDSSSGVDEESDSNVPYDSDN